MRETSTSSGPGLARSRARRCAPRCRRCRRPSPRTRRCAGPPGSGCPAARTTPRISAAHSNRAGRPVEGREEPVAGRLHLAAAVALEGVAARRAGGARAPRASAGRRARWRSRVESTMSVNSTVARTRSGSTTARAPVRNSCTSPSDSSGSSYHPLWSSPSSSTSRASGRCSASQRPLRTLTRRSCAPVQDQRRRVDARDDVADVEVEEHLRQHHHHPRARGRALQAARELARLGVVGLARRRDLDDRASPQSGRMNSAADSISASAGHRPRVVLGPGRARAAAVADERLDALGIGRREQQAHRDALRDPEQRSALRAGGVHDRAHVVHPLSSVGASATGSDSPEPRRSNAITRANDASPRASAAPARAPRPARRG